MRAHVIFFAMIFSLLTFQLSTSYAEENAENSYVSYGLRYTMTEVTEVDAQSFDIDDTYYSTIEASISSSDLFFKFGVTGTQDISKIDDYVNILGYVGIGDFTLRASSGKIEGTYTDDVTNERTNLSTKRSFYDLVYGKTAMVGLRYSDYEVPAEFGSNGDYSTHLDPKASITVYQFVFAIDSMRHALLNNDKNNGVYIYNDTAFGIGKYKLSDIAVNKYLSDNPGATVVSKDGSYFELHQSLTLGYYYIFDTSIGKIGCAAGYGFELVSGTPFEDEGRTNIWSNEHTLALDSTQYLNHGPSLKIAYSW